MSAITPIREPDREHFLPISRRVITVSDWLAGGFGLERESIRAAIGTLPQGARLVVTVQALVKERAE